MDRAFMEEYFMMKYEDAYGAATKGNEELRKADCAARQIEHELEELSGGMETEIWKKHEEFMLAKLEVFDIAFRLVYLMGAEDRDKMLK